MEKNDEKKRKSRRTVMLRTQTTRKGRIRTE
jgi:hypothetical protein